MHSIRQSLIWKEWHEQKWKLAALFAIAFTIHILRWGFPNEIGPRADADNFFMALLRTYCMVAPLFLAMAVATGDRTQGTKDFIRTLPCAPPYVAAFKLGSSVLTLILPLFATILLFWVGTSLPMEEVTGPTLIAIGCTVSLFFWFTAVAIEQPTELRAGLAGVIMLAVWGGLFSFPGVRDPQPGLVTTLVWFGPFGWFTLFGSFRIDTRQLPIGLILFVQCLGVASAVGWTLVRYGRRQGNARLAPTEKTNKKSRSSNLAPPRRNRAMALAWLQTRELGPLLMTGITFVIGLTIVCRLMQRDWVQALISVLQFISVRDRPLGVVLSLVIGIASFSADFHPRVFAFWRSRPINPSAWFWTKFVSGAAVLLACLNGPIVLLILLFGADFAVGFAGLGYLNMSSFLTYVVAVCMICLIRHAIYAGILAFGLIVVWEWGTAHFVYYFFPYYGSYGRYEGTLLLTISVLGLVLNGALLIIAWMAATRDWGKSLRAS